MPDQAGHTPPSGLCTLTRSGIKVPHNSPAASLHSDQSVSLEIPISSPHFQQTVPPKIPVSNLFYKCSLKEASGKGFGLFAEQDIPKGKIIIVERPSLVHGPLMEEQDNLFWCGPKNINNSSTKTGFLDMFMKLSPEDQSDFMLLDNCREEQFQSREWSPGDVPNECTISGKFLTNRFRISSELTGIYFRCSFLNHSCEPNCNFQMVIRNDMMVGTGHKWLSIRAEQEIKAGDELTISYIPRSTTFEERQAFLFWCYGFRCVCIHCLKDKARLYPDDYEGYIFRNKQNVQLQKIKPDKNHARPQGREFVMVIRAITGEGPLFPKNGIILEETPLMLITKEELRIIGTDSGQPCQGYHPMITRFLQLSTNARREFLSLHSLDTYQNDNATSIMEDPIPSPEALFNIWKVNRIALGTGMEGVFSIISNLSHSCKPTCQVSWNPERKALNLVATKTLKAGDEITICYERSKIFGTSFRKRQHYLKGTYGFDCRCSKCTDEIRWEISLPQAEKNLTHLVSPLEESCGRNFRDNRDRASYRFSKASSSALLGQEPGKRRKPDENQRPAMR